MLYQLVILVNFPLVGCGTATTTPLNREPVCHAAICAPNRDLFQTETLPQYQTDLLPGFDLGDAALPAYEGRSAGRPPAAGVGVPAPDQGYNNGKLLDGGGSIRQSIAHNMFP